MIAGVHNREALQLLDKLATSFIGGGGFIWIVVIAIFVLGFFFFFGGGFAF